MAAASSPSDAMTDHFWRLDKWKASLFSRNQVSPPCSLSSWPHEAQVATTWVEKRSATQAAASGGLGVGRGRSRDQQFLFLFHHSCSGRGRRQVGNKAGSIVQVVFTAGQSTERGLTPSKLTVVCMLCYHQEKYL